LYCFFRFSTFEYSGWTETRFKNGTDWQIKRVGLRANKDIECVIHDICEIFEQRILEKLKTDFGPDEEEAPNQDLPEDDDSTSSDPTGKRRPKSRDDAGAPN